MSVAMAFKGKYLTRCVIITLNLTTDEVSHFNYLWTKNFLWS